MGISRQAWYQSLQRERGREKQAQRIVEQVTAIRLQQPRLGTRKLHYLLRQQAEPALHVGRDRLFQILRCSRLLVMQNGRIIKRQTAIIVFTVTLTY